MIHHPWGNGDRLPEGQVNPENDRTETTPWQEQPPSVSRGQVWSGLALSLGISVGGLVALFWLVSDDLPWRQLAAFHWGYGLVAVVLLAAGWMADAFRWWLLVTTLGGRLRWRDLLRVVFAGYFLSGVTPFVSGGGPVQVYALTQHGLTMGQGTAVVVASGLVNQLVLAGGALVITGAFDFTARALGPWTDAAVYLYLSGLLVYLTAVLNTERFLRTSAALGRRLGLSRWWAGGRGARFRQKLLRAGADFHQALHLLLRHPAPLALGLLSTGLFYLLFFSLAPVLLRGLGGSVPFWPAQGLQNVFWLLCTLMPTPGGSGAAELGFVAIFSGWVPVALLPPLAAAWRLVTFYLRLLVGWPCFVALFARRRRGYVPGAGWGTA